MRPLALPLEGLEAPVSRETGNVTAVAAVERNWRRVAT